MELGSPSKRRRGEFPQSLLPQALNQDPISMGSGFFLLRSLDGDDPSPRSRIRLRSDRVYTVGRKRRHCDISFHGNRRISRRHCQFFLDSFQRKLLVVDGFFTANSSNLDEIRRRFHSGQDLESSSRTRASLNGIFVNGRRLQRGASMELYVGDEILLACRNGLQHDFRIRCGFVVERVAFSEGIMGRPHAHDVLDIKANGSPKDSISCRSGHKELITRATFLLNQCRSILQSADPVPYICRSLYVNRGKEITNTARIFEQNSVTGLDKFKHLCSSVDQLEPGVYVINPNVEDFCKDKSADQQICSVVKVDRNDCRLHLEKDAGLGCSSAGNTFFLNRLEFMDPGSSEHCNTVSLPELLHPVGSLMRVFIATFTSDVLCYPPFPEIIAFGQDRKRQGVGCHHPKLIVLQREDNIRVIVTSANLVSRQWNNITNTIWWQDFPRRNTPDYSALFTRLSYDDMAEDSKSDFAAQLAQFMASLITDVPSQAYWITELTKYDFGGAVGHLVASIPGIHSQNTYFSQMEHCLSAKEIVHSQSSGVKILGSVQASVVGLSHRFHTADSNGAQVKSLASFLRKCQQNACGMSEVFLKRNTSIPVDVNAMSVLVGELDEFSEGDYIQLGFLPKDVAKWVSPLSDMGFFSFSACIFPKEALAAALGGSSTKVQLILYVSQGPNFSEISRMIQPEHIAPLSSLLASIQRCVGLWRLQEVLCRYRWPESLETDFIYGSSSVGSSLNPQFLAAFSAAAGKRSYQFSDSEESDPEWGCWNINHELKCPSMRILFPTIERVKMGACGVHSSRRLLSLSEKTWQRLRGSSIFHDAIPHPSGRLGYPMHVKVACRRFQSKIDSSPFGWIYCGSHNFSPAAWGHVISHSSEAKVPGAALPSALGPRLRICNYELGIVFIFPPSETCNDADQKRLNLDDICLPFVMPAPKYQHSDRPATAQAMREVALLEKESSVTAEDMIDEEIPEEEEEMDVTEFIAEEKEEEKIYAEMLWSQVDSSES